MSKIQWDEQSHLLPLVKDKYPKKKIWIQYGTNLFGESYLKTWYKKLIY